MLKKLFRAYASLVVGVMTCLFMVLILVVSYQVFSRYVDLVPRLLWTEEAARFCFVWVVLIGAAIAVREGRHFTIDVLPEGLPPGWRRILSVLGLVVIAAIGMLMVVGGLTFAEIGVSRISTTSGISLAWVYAAVPFSGFSILVFTVEKFVDLYHGGQTRLGTREGTGEV